MLNFYGDFLGEKGKTGNICPSPKKQSLFFIKKIMLTK